jgi:aspartate/methionine/tyrosine aminotransferase
MSQLVRGGAPLAERVSALGDETVFTVAAEAYGVEAAGQKVYPFHLGNVGFPTPPNIVEAMNKAVRDGKTGYCLPAGIPELREAIAGDVGRARGLEYGPENVAVQPGGKPVIGKFLLALMNPGDEVLYPNPGFPIYSSLINFFGGVAVPYTYRETGTRFELDLDGLEQAVTSRTQLLILNDCHNPSGAELSVAELDRIAGIVRDQGLCVLLDEAYFDIRLDGGRSRSLASLPDMRERCVILYTFAKKYAMGGWRLGASIAPRHITDVFVRLNTNLESCTNHFTQYAAVEALTGDQSATRQMLATLKERRDVAARLLNSTEGVTCLRPDTTFYLYPNVTGAMKKGGFTDYESFRRAVLRETGVSLCTRAHFGDPLEGEDRFYLRLSYSGIDSAEIEEGLTRLKVILEGGRPQIACGR